MKILFNLNYNFQYQKYPGSRCGEVFKYREGKEKNRTQRNGSQGFRCQGRKTKQLKPV